MDKYKTVTARDRQKRKGLFRAVLLYLLVIAVVEFMIMLSINGLDHKLEWLTVAILDATLLIIVLFPISYFMILKPLHAHLLQALRQSEDQFQSLTKTATDAILGVDEFGKISIWNDAATKMLGYKASYAIGHSLDTLVVPQGYRATLRDALAYHHDSDRGNGGGETLELVLLHKDGTEIPVELSASSYLRNGCRHATAIIRNINHRKQTEAELLSLTERLRKSLITTVQIVARAAEAKDSYTGGHQLRVSRLARRMAQEMGLESQQVEGIRLGALVHDIGKIQIPSELLSKPTKLSAAEFELIKEHALNGYNILKGIEFPWPIAEIAYQHHERWDGSGYPQGLKGEAICLEARVVAVADVVEAIGSHRPYRASKGHQEALDEITKNRGKKYCPIAVDACLKVFADNFSFE